MKHERILVVEDKEEHLDGIKQLEDAGLKVDVAIDFIEAITFLGYGSENSKPQYGALLTDMMFPLGGKGEYGEFANLNTEGNRQRYHETPLGYALALYAAKQNVPRIAIVTDMNHHQSPIAATFDLFYAVQNEQQGVKIGSGNKRKAILSVNDSKVVMFDIRDLDTLMALEDGSLTTEWSREGKQVKNWLDAYQKIRSIE